MAAFATPPTEAQARTIRQMAFERFDQSVRVNVPADKATASKLIEHLMTLPPIEIHPRQVQDITDLVEALNGMVPNFEAPKMPTDRRAGNLLRVRLQQLLDNRTAQANADLSSFITERPLKSDAELVAEATVAESDLDF